MSLRLASSRRGFTLLETIMAMASVGVVGLSIFYTLYFGMILFTKNTAMNVSHEEARLALLQLSTDIHQAVSPLCLTDSNGVMISGSGPAAGVEFQVMVTSTEYCQISGSATAGSTTIKVAMPPGYPTPYAGLNLIVPDFNYYPTVSAVSVSGSVATCTVNAGPANNIDGTSSNILCYFTQRVYYYVNGPPSYVQNGVTVTPPLTLTYIGLGKTKTYSVGAEDLTSRYPFSLPLNSSSQTNLNAVVVTGLTAEDPQASYLNSIFTFNTSSILLNGTIPAYATLFNQQ